MYPDIVSQTSIQSGTSASSTGSAFDTSRLSRSSVFVSVLTNGSGTGTGSQLYVDIEATHVSGTNSEWFIVDHLRYESGTSTQTDVVSYSTYFPWMRTSVIGSNIGTFQCNTTITGRGV